MTVRKFYKTTFLITVLHEEPGYHPDDLGDIHHDIVDGNFSGNFEQNETIQLDGKQAADELSKMGSEPSWFNLDENGNDNREERSL